MGNNKFRSDPFEKLISLMNILCRENEELEPFYWGNSCTHTVISFGDHWSFSNIDLEMQKRHPPFL